MEVRRWLPLGGIAFVVLLVLAVVVLAGDHPEADAPASEIAAFYEENSGRQSLAAFVLAASAPFIVLFALSLAAAVTSSTAGDRFWERVAAAGGAVTAAAAAVAALIHFALANGGEQEIDPVAAQALSAIDSEVWLPITAGLGILALGAAGLLLTTARLPRWLGWGALVLGVGLFVPIVSFLALVVMLLWILVASVLLFRLPAVEPDDRRPPVAA